MYVKLDPKHTNVATAPFCHSFWLCLKGEGWEGYRCKNIRKTGSVEL